jgi:hypothetical protein
MTPHTTDLREHERESRAMGHHDVATLMAEQATRSERNEPFADFRGFDSRDYHDCDHCRAERARAYGGEP